MTQFDRVDEVSPRQAAEYLVDIAYALAAGDMVELRSSTGRVHVPVGDHLVIARRSIQDGDRVELAIELRWSA